MKHYLSLIPIYAKIHKKQNRMTKLCIALAVFLVTGIFSMANMEMKSQYYQAVKTDGNWHAIYKATTSEQQAMITARPEVKAYSRYDVLNYRLDQDYSVCGEKVAVCAIDQDFCKLIPSAAITEGHFPENENEIIISENAKDKLQVAIGTKILLSMPEQIEKELTVCGFTQNTGSLSKDDAMGILINIEGFETLAPEIPQEHHVFYVQYAANCYIPEIIEDTCKEIGIPYDSVGQNAKLLGTMGMSRDSYIMQLYGVAAVLAVLVITAGILMITSNFNSNVARRTEFFGLMSCLGATRKQIKKFVCLEALNWCKNAIPIGTGGGIVITWILCAMLRLANPQYFSEMPVLEISPVGIIAGAVVGVITVLLAAAAPARHAASVSPLTALFGNTGMIRAVKKGANLRRCYVETALGIHHAKAGKKNFFLMIGSFAFSIILFLAFTTAVDFMNHALTPMQPYTPDISVISPDNTCSVPAKLFNDIEEKAYVKKAYGRMFNYQIPADINDQTISINLISYEKNQFEWAKEYLSDGNLQEVLDGQAVLTVFDMNNPLKTGDILKIENMGELKVAGVLTKCPFSRENNVETIICSEEMFQRLTNEQNYTILDIQLKKNATDADAAELRNLCRGDFVFSDQRQNNREIRATFYSFAIFVYGFLAIIALISVFNIINSISMSVSARIGQYGTMRAIGMSDKQVIRMITSEAFTYGLFGILFGLVAGLPINRFLFEGMITSRWGDAWYLPITPTLIIVFVVVAALILSIMGPSRRIKEMTIVDTIRGE